MSFMPGDLVMREGEPGDHYFLIDEGEVDVSAGGRYLRTCGPGDGVGEIALLRRVPRTATVVAKTPVSGYAIDASTFLASVSGPAAAAAAEAVASSRLKGPPDERSRLDDRGAERARDELHRGEGSRVLAVEDGVDLDDLE
jgi:CRP-like cAMP-binding protein